MLHTRIITALVIAPVALVGVFLLPPFEFSLFVGAVLVVAAWEWGTGPGSITVTEYPRRRSSREEVRPKIPAPTMTMDSMREPSFLRIRRQAGP